MRSRPVRGAIGMCSCTRRARRACCWSSSRGAEPAASSPRLRGSDRREPEAGGNGGEALKQREQIRDEIVEIVNRETRAWDTKDAELLISVFHPDMVWPWPRTAQSHDPVDWVMVLGRFDRERWKQVWQQLFDTHTLAHNRRRIEKLEISEQGDGAFAVLDVATLSHYANWRNFLLKLRPSHASTCI